MNNVINTVATVVRKIASVFQSGIANEEAQAKALVSKIEAKALEGYAKAEALSGLAAEIVVHAANHRTRAKSLNALSGRLSDAVSTKAD